MPSDKILIVCYYFPPLGAAGAGRPLSLLKYLPEYDYDCDILTVKNVAYRFYDKKLLEGLDLKKIYRTGSRDPQRLLYLLGMRTVKDKTISKGKAISNRYFPDSKIGWVKPAVKLGRVLSENKNYKAIISTSPPISAHLVAMQLASEFKIPWIADFRDYWTSYKAEDWFDDSRKIKKAKQLLNRITTSANEVVAVSEDCINYLGKGKLIQNCYDHERAKLWQSPEVKEYFYIGLLGTFDSITPIEPLFVLFNKFCKEYPELYNKIKLCHVGDIKTENIDELLQKYNLKDKFISHGIKNREETIKILNQSSMFYFGLSGGNRKGILTSRIYDIFASGRPVIASVPDESEVKNMITATGNGICYYNNYEDACLYLRDKLESYFANQLIIKPCPDYAKEYSSSNMAAKYANFIKSII